jgi:hypothetical protein
MQSIDGMGDCNEDSIADAATLATGEVSAPFGVLSAGSEPPSIRQSLPGATGLHVGGDLGALMLYTTPDLIGSEILLIPEGHDEPHTKGLVAERQLIDGVSFAAVFPYLRQGAYTIEGSDQKVSIVGGRVTTLEYHDGCCRIYYHPSPMTAFANGSEL